MPLYEYVCESCHHIWDTFSSVDDRLQPTYEPCPKCDAHKVRINFGAPPIADPVRLGRIKPSEGFRDVLRNIKHRNYKSTIDVK